MLFRGLTAALLGQPAAGIEARHPHLTRTAKAALQPLLGFPLISTRLHEVTYAWVVPFAICALHFACVHS